MAAAAAALAAAPAAGAVARDFAGPAYNVLPPGESGATPPDRNSTDQADLYDGLTPLFDKVSSSDVRRLFKPNVFGTAGQGPTRGEQTPRGDRVKIVRDRWGVAHITGKTRDDVAYGAGWVSAADRSTLMELLRGPARLAAMDAPAADALALIESDLKFTPSVQANAMVSQQEQALEEKGDRGRRILRDLDQYIEGINDEYRTRGRPHAPWSRADVFSMVALLAGVFGQGGGDEARRSELLDGLQQRLGAEKGWQAWDDVREQFDSETDVSVEGRFPYGRKIPGGGDGNAIVDDGSVSREGAVGIPGLARLDPFPSIASNALLVGSKRSRTGHPLLVAGPQTGYFYPQVLMEMDLHGGGIDARGVGVPGFAVALVIGRGQDFVWSLTSATNDNTDEYVEELCGSDLVYRYKGECRPMDVVNAGLIEGDPTDPGGTELAFRSTVHGPVVAYATVDGRRVAISQKRATRNREVASALPIEALMTNKVRSAADFRRHFSRDFEVTFNAFYADDRDIAMVSTGLLPKRPDNVDTGLPTKGTGEYEWEGFLEPEKHPQQTNPRDGTILNWNNKPAQGFGSADNRWAYGSVVRNELFKSGIGRSRKHSLTSVVRAMNMAATQDLRNDQVLGSIHSILVGTTPPNDRSRRMLDLLLDWREEGSSRLDRDLDGRIDHPGAAIMDESWPRIADAVMSPVFGDKVDHLERLNTRDNKPNSQGSAYNTGWYSYVDKDLRTLAEDARARRGARAAAVRSRFHLRYCGEGDLERCRESLWAAINEAGEELEKRQGPNPDNWRSDATNERIKFLPGLLPRDMRWTNRPTFQQVISFEAHRRRASRRPRFTG